MDLQQIIDECNKIVFFGGAVYRRKAEYPISEVLTGFIIKNTTILPRRYFRTRFSTATLLIFLNFTGIKC